MSKTQKGLLETPDHISIEHTNCISRVDIELKPGVLVFQGDNGTGKSSAIDAITETVGGKSTRPLTPQDGYEKGQVQVGELKLTIGKSRVTRNAAVKKIESSLDISELIDPQLKDPDRADARRLQAILKITAAEADFSKYKEAFGEIVPDFGVKRIKDPIELHREIRRWLLNRQRFLERERDESRGELRMLQQSLPDEPEETISVAEAQQQHEDAVAEKQRLQARREQAQKSRAQAIDLQATIKGSDEQAASVETLQEELESCERAIRELEDSRVRIKQQIAQAEERARCVAALEALDLSGPSDDDLIEANSRIAEASAQLTRAQKAVDIADTELQIEKAKQAIADQSVCLSDVKYALEEAEHVFKQIVPTSEIKVIDGRLFVDTDRKTNERYHELSDGTRGRLAVLLAARHSADGILTLAQHVWEGFSPATKQAIADEVTKQNCTLVTGEATDGELQAEYFHASGT